MEKVTTWTKYLKPRQRQRIYQIHTRSPEEISKRGSLMLKHLLNANHSSTWDQVTTLLVLSALVTTEDSTDT